MANPAAADLLGMENPEVLTEQSWAQFGQDFSAEELWRQAEASADQQYRRDIRLRRVDGRQVLLDAFVVVSSHYGDGRLQLIGFDVSDHRRREHREANMARFDSLTGMLSRAAVEKHLDRLFDDEAGTPGLLFIDLDDFKVVNDSMGHAVGDTILAEVAGRLIPENTEDVWLGRWGGDEFVAVVKDVARYDLESLAGELLERLKPPFEYGGKTFFLTATMGLTDGDRSGSPSAMFRDADAAMYAANAAGKRHWCQFKPEMHEAARNRIETDTRLREGLAQDQFEAFFQPRIRAADGLPCGFEALARWHHPKRGLVAPGEFIAVAESTGQISDLDLVIARQACRASRLWAADGPQAWTVSFNVSARSLNREGFAEYLGDLLPVMDAADCRFEVELTETVLMNRSETVTRNLQAIQDRGIHLAIDDFGTGYSSLRYLDELPAASLKIDRGFVANFPDSSAIVQAAISMAHAFGMTVIAEGVETREQALALRSMGCDQLQGYLFAKPMSPADAEAWYEQHHNQSFLED